MVLEKVECVQRLDIGDKPIVVNLFNMNTLNRLLDISNTNGTR